MVIMELLGMPLADWDEFQRWAQMTVPRGPGSLQEEMAGYTAIRGYFADLVARKTREPGGDDLLSALVAVRDEGRRLDEDEPPGMAWLLLTAGHTTTVDLIGSGVLALLRHPRPIRRCARRPEPVACRDRGDGEARPHHPAHPLPRPTASACSHISTAG